MRDELLLYYERELDYLRKSAAQFAEKHPKVASRLVLEPTKCEDPHVERLLEAFAFLAARVHLKLEDEFPEITEALLSVVYPQLVRPIPSMSVVEFQLDPEKGKLTSGLRIDRNSQLFSKPISGVPCTFRTCYETTLWPVTVAAAELSPPSRLKPAVKTNDSAWAIRLELRCAKDVNFVSLKPDKLRFYLDGESGLVNIVYELLFSRLNRIQIRDLTANSKQAPVTLPASALTAVGFGPNEGMVPYPSSSFAGHRLLMEYFAFPEKFFFIDLCGLEAVSEAGFKDAIEVIFLLVGDRGQRPPAAPGTGAFEEDLQAGLRAGGEPVLAGGRAYSVESAQGRVLAGSRCAAAVLCRGVFGRRSQRHQLRQSKNHDLRTVLLAAPLRAERPFVLLAGAPAAFLAAQ